VRELLDEDHTRNFIPQLHTYHGEHNMLLKQSLPRTSMTLKSSPPKLAASRDGLEATCEFEVAM
jgi:hypothetical protein